MLGVSRNSRKSYFLVQSKSESESRNIQYNETQAVGVTYNVWSDLDKNEANVGEHVLWRIYYPIEYQMTIDSCTANPGTSYDSATSISLIQRHCSLSTDLISNFTSADGVATATINAFKFYDNNNVFLYCSLTVCPSEWLGCYEFCVDITKRQVKETESNDSKFRSEIGQVLSIIDTDTNGSKPLSGLGITSTILIVLASQL